MHQSAADGGDGAGNIVVWQKFKWNRRDRGSDRFRHRLYTPGFSECRRNHPDFKSVGSDDTSRQRGKSVSCGEWRNVIFRGTVRVLSWN